MKLVIDDGSAVEEVKLGSLVRDKVSGLEGIASARCQLHQSKFFEFELFLKFKGWTIHEPRGGYEVIRAVKKGENTIVL